MCMHETSKPDLVISPLIEQTQSARFALIERIFEDLIYFRLILIFFLLLHWLVIGICHGIALGFFIIILLEPSKKLSIAW